MMSVVFSAGIAKRFHEYKWLNVVKVIWLYLPELMSEEYSSMFVTASIWWALLIVFIYGICSDNTL